MIRSVLIDLSGTLHVENSAIPGAVNALKKLRNAHIPFKFLTNTTKESKQLLYKKLTNLGFEIEPSEIITSLTAANDIIKKRNLNPFYLVSDEALEDFELKTRLGAKIDTVVIGLAPKQFNYVCLNEAFQHLMEGAFILAIHEGRYYKAASGLGLGPGCFVRGLQYSTKCKVEVVGKPNTSFYLSAVDEKVPPEEVVMIGDDIVSDIKGAQEAGMMGCLVKTGKYLESDLEKFNVKPTMVFPSIVEAVDEILKRNCT